MSKEIKRKISRAELRGKPLEPECKKANTTTNEYGKDDNRVYCYGLFQNNIHGFGSWIADCCRNCKAYVENSTPLSEVKDNE